MIGIVGGVGSGKSSVVSGLRGMSLLVIDADRIGHQQLQRPEIRAALVAQFGPEILSAAGEIDRPTLARVVFGETSEQQAARRVLDQIVRPGIRAEILRQLQDIPPDTDAVLLDAALLLEAGLDQYCDQLIFIDTPESQRRHRVSSSRGWSADELQRREQSQWSVDRKRAACSHSIDNSGSLAAATARFQQLLQEMLHHPRSTRPSEYRQ